MAKRSAQTATTGSEHDESIPVDTSSAEQRHFLLAALSLAILSLWILSLRGGLWIDELGTYWVIKDGLKQTIHRAAEIQGQTPLYYVIEWFTRTVGGKSELALRLPSLIAMGLAAYLIYRIAVRLLDREAAIIATIVFSTMNAVAFEASDARPYALALLMLVAATLFLVRWIDNGGIRDGIGYVLLAALTVYSHYLFGLALLAHFGYAYARRDRVRLKGILFAICGTGIFLIPAVPQLLSLFGRRASLSVPTSHFAQQLFDTIMPSVLTGGIALGLLVARSREAITFRRAPIARGALALGAGWLLISPLILYSVSTFTSIRVFTDRYLITAAPGLALLAAAGLISINHERTRRIAVLALLVSSVFVYGSATHNNEDWRGAISHINSLVDRIDTPVLVHSALVEAGQVSWLRDPYKASYLMDPISYYLMKGRPIPMPYYFTDEARTYLDTLLPMLRATNHFILVTRYAFVESPVYLQGRLAGDGFVLHIAGQFGSVTIYDYRKVPRS